MKADTTREREENNRIRCADAKFDVRYGKFKAKTRRRVLSRANRQNNGK